MGSSWAIPLPCPLPDVILERNRLVNLWFPQYKTRIWTTGDPSGENKKDTGLSSAATLRKALIHFHSRKTGNSVSARLWAIGQLQGLMGRRVKGQECFALSPRCVTLRAALERGYVKDARRSDAMPKKDGVYDHLSNALEYLVMEYSGMADDVVRADGTVDVKQLLANDRDPGEPKAPREDWHTPSSSVGTRRHAGGF